MSEAEIAVLKQRVEAIEKHKDELQKDVRWLRQQVSDLIATARTIRWILGLALPLGPTLGVAIAKVLE